jgi:hypothetical protein
VFVHFVFLMRLVLEITSQAENDRVDSPFLKRVNVIGTGCYESRV